MIGWKIRHEGSPQAVVLASAQRVLEGIRDGDWEPSDEVLGPNDRDWQAIADHPQFAEAIAAMEPPPAPLADETRLDMNPMIDVALVLLIFFILTTTYASLRRAIDLPPEPPEEHATKTQQILKPADIEDRAFKVRIWMEKNQPVIQIENKMIPVGSLEREVRDFVKATGRKELFVEVAADVPWGIEAALYDAAKGADIHRIYWPAGR
jgi:biopolymer transport protein ExbD